MTKLFCIKLAVITLIVFGISAFASADTGSGKGQNMERLICKYCGREVRSSSGKLTFQGSDRCNSAPNGKHILISIPGVCVYCGRPVKTASGRLVFQGSAVCNASPTKKHQLQN